MMPFHNKNIKGENKTRTITGQLLSTNKQFLMVTAYFITITLKYTEDK